MASSTFELFSILPPELRRQIYLLATPPRIVHVKESPGPNSEGYQKFKEWLLDSPSLSIHPSLANFAHNWRYHVKDHSQQSLRQAESSNITKSSRQPQPWTPSSEVPEVDPILLRGNPALAWSFCRESHLSTSAPIPSLLHTWRESRKVLMDHGYQLAFKTRTAEPRTWFCFKDDILFLESGTVFSSRNLDGGELNIGQFDPDELRKLRRLAVGKLEPDQPRMVLEVSNALRLIPKLQELLWVSVNANNLGFEWHSAGEAVAKEFIKHNNLYDGGLDYMSCEDEELTESSLAWCEPWWYHWARLGNAQPKLQDGVQVGNSLDDVSTYVHRKLNDDRDTVVRNEGAFEWSIPSVKFIHVGFPHLLDLLRRERAKSQEKDQERKEYEIFWRFCGGV